MRHAVGMESLQSKSSLRFCKSNGRGSGTLEGAKKRPKNALFNPPRAVFDAKGLHGLYGKVVDLGNCMLHAGRSRGEDESSRTVERRHHALRMVSIKFWRDNRSSFNQCVRVHGLWRLSVWFPRLASTLKLLLLKSVF